MSGWHCRDCGKLNNEFGGCECEKKRVATLLGGIMAHPITADNSAVKKLMAVLSCDAAGYTVPQLLAQAADYLESNGGGPLRDRLLMASEAVASAMAAVEAPL